MVYNQQIQFNSSAVITLRWQDFKQLVINKMLLVQYITNVDGYCVFSFDQNIAYKCTLIFTTLSSDYPFDYDYSQTQNDLDVADFLTNYLPKTNKPIIQNTALNGVPITSDGRIRIAAEKSSLNKSTIYSPNYCDQTTWFPSAVYVVNETVSQSVDGYYHLAHSSIIDSYHGKISNEDYLLGPDGYSLRVTVVQDGYTMTEQDPHFATGGDYVINYTTGIIYPVTLNQPITVTYHYANGSTFTINPPTGMEIIIDSAECEFSTDIILTDTVEFIVMGYASVFAPQLGLPAGYRIPLSTTKYKTMNDFYNDAVKSYPVYPPMGGSGWRGVNVPSTVLNWDYISATAISSALGMQVIIKLEHDTPFGGLYATTTFFTIVQADSNI